MKACMTYPLHIGVTEAGSGEQGRIKSSAGIGALLEDGIGDTIRVSLTEEPEIEIPVAKVLISRYQKNYSTRVKNQIEISPINPFEFHKHHSKNVLNIGNDNVPVVITTGENIDDGNL